MFFFGKHIWFCVLVFFAAAFLLRAETDSETGVESKTSLSLAISSLPEAKLTATQSFIVPFLQGGSALVQNNNVRFDLAGEVTPVSMGLLWDAIWTPIAFIELNAGGLLGSGWKIDLFGSEIRGNGLNVPDDKGNTSLDGSAFDGTFIGGHFGGAFQFDLAAVVPGDWNHVLFRSYHAMRYRSYSRAGPDDPWFYEDDYGENQNGWRYYGNYLIGYRMPIFLDTVAFLAEMEKYLYNTPGSDQWGGNMGRWDFALLLNFKITEKFGAALVTQFRLYRNYKEYGYNSGERDVFYRDRHLEDGRNFKFYRMAAILNYSLR